MALLPTAPEPSIRRRRGTGAAINSTPRPLMPGHGKCRYLVKPAAGSSRFIEMPSGRPGRGITIHLCAMDVTENDQELQRCLHKLHGHVTALWQVYQQKGSGRVERSLYHRVDDAANAVERVLERLQRGGGSAGQMMPRAKHRTIADAVSQLRELCYRCACTAETPAHEMFESNLATIDRHCRKQ